MRASWVRRRFGPRCAAPPPWRLADAAPCIRWRVHSGGDDGWHADGGGFIWNDELGRWQWQGPVIGPEEYDVAKWGYYREPPGGEFTAVFTEWKDEG